MQVSTKVFVVVLFNDREATQADLFTGLLGGGDQVIVERPVSRLQFQGGFHVGRLVVNNQVSNILQNGLERVGSGHEVSFGVQFNDRSGVTLHHDVSQTFSGDPVALLSGLSDPLFTKVIHCLVHVTFTSNEGLLGVHDPGTGLLAQFHHLLCTNFSH